VTKGKTLSVRRNIGNDSHEVGQSLPFNRKAIRVDFRDRLQGSEEHVGIGSSFIDHCAYEGDPDQIQLTFHIEVTLVTFHFTNFFRLNRVPCDFLDDPNQMLARSAALENG